MHLLIIIIDVDILFLFRAMRYQMGVRTGEKRLHKLNIKNEGEEFNENVQLKESNWIQGH